MFAMRRAGRSFWADNGAAIAPLYALALFALIGVGGIAFDYARLVSMDSELQNAADQAALAAATQLTRVEDAKANAENAALEYFSAHGYNKTLFANDSHADGTAAKVVTVEFYSNRPDAEAETNGFSAASTAAGEGDEDANFVRVVIKTRTANYALTPVVGALSDSITNAAATAGMGSAVCKVPPIMICHPDPDTDIDWDDMEGVGVQATGHNPGNSNGKGGNSGNNDTTGTTWSPGNFGFLQVNDPGDNGNRNAALMKALAYVNPPLDCTLVGENRVSTGNPQGLYDAINTRFDIYDFNNNGNGNVLAPCISGTCPPAPNVVKDFANSNPAGNNGCKIKNGNGAGPGWSLPNTNFEFKPVSTGGTATDTLFNANTVRTTIMGLPRDNCHYTSYNDGHGPAADGLCADGNGRFGDGLWARKDYFKHNHGGTLPSGYETWTRYDTYLWELDGHMPSVSGQYATNICSATVGAPERRVMTVAVVSNCDELHGTSVPVDIDEWVDVFLVEPSTDKGNGGAPRWNSAKDSIYFEIIGKSKTAGGYTYGVQTVRRDVPYLVR